MRTKEENDKYWAEVESQMPPLPKQRPVLFFFLGFLIGVTLFLPPVLYLYR